MITTGILMVCAWVCGSIPFGRIMMVLFANASMDSYGTANVPPILIWHTGRHRLALATAALEMGKCALPLAITASLVTHPYAVTLAFTACLVGHYFSPFNRFRPSLSLGPVFGGTLILSVTAAALSGILWIGSFLLYRRPVFSSLLVALCLPFMLFATGQAAQDVVAALPLLALVFFVHRRQLVRLLKKKEPAWF